jgi:hypothetical protein
MKLITTGYASKHLSYSSVTPEATLSEVAEVKEEKCEN